MATAERAKKGRGKAGKARPFDAARYVRSSVKGRKAPVTDDQRLACIAALERAKKVIEGELTNKRARPIPGTIACNLAVAISGDVVVGAPVPLYAKEATTFNDRDVLLAMLSGFEPADREYRVREAVRAINRAATDSATATVIGECEQLADSVTLDEARTLKLVETKGGGTKAGAVTGKPGVVVGGTVNSRGVRIEIDV